jgi:hypothetical protein
MKPRHLERIDWAPSPSRPPNTTTWPFTIPAVAQLIAQGGLDIGPGVTFLVGENATLLQLGDDGISKVESYDELTLVKDWRAFLAGPGRYLRHLVGEPG